MRPGLTAAESTLDAMGCESPAPRGQQWPHDEPLGRRAWSQRDQATATGAVRGQAALSLPGAAWSLGSWSVWFVNRKPWMGFSRFCCQRRMVSSAPESLWKTELFSGILCTGNSEVTHCPVQHWGCGCVNPLDLGLPPAGLRSCHIPPSCGPLRDGRE